MLARLRERSERAVDRGLRQALTATLARAHNLAVSPASPSPKWGIVLVAFDPRRSLEALRMLRPPSELGGRLVVVANSSEAYDALSAIPGFDLVRGTNSAHEFSGYDEGLDRLREDLPVLEAVVFANDRCGSYRDGFSELVTTALVHFSSKERLALGNLDDPGRAFSTPFGPLRRYLRGNLMVIPVGALPGDFRITTIDGRQFDEAVSRAYDPTTTLEDRLAPMVQDPEYAHFLDTWLSTGWYRGGQVSEENWEALRAKTRDILNEHWLTARLKAEGVRAVYAERAAALAMWPDSESRSAALSDVVAEADRVGAIAHGDASAARTARSLSLALRALVNRQLNRGR